VRVLRSKRENFCLDAVFDARQSFFFDFSSEYARTGEF
jgi:hypothetical protein